MKQKTEEIEYSNTLIQTVEFKNCFLFEVKLLFVLLTSFYFIMYCKWSEPLSCETLFCMGYLCRFVFLFKLKKSRRRTERLWLCWLHTPLERSPTWFETELNVGGDLSCIMRGRGGKGYVSMVTYSRVWKDWIIKPDWRFKGQRS